MGESLLNSPVADKMGETASSNPALEVSVSFGRFDNDSLSWEKWSSFSPNKYLEEVEKFATPGSVAQKKAYFEAHYKKIAAKKAELLDQEKDIDSGPWRSNDQSCGDLSGNDGRTGTEFDISNDKSSVEGEKQETKFDTEVSDTQFNIANEDAKITVECQGSSVVLPKELNGSLDSPKSIKTEEADLEREEVETPSVMSRDTRGSNPKSDKERENTPKVKKENVKLQNESHKNFPVNKEKKMVAMTKKPVSSVPRTPQFSTQKVSKPKPTALTMSTSQFSTTKANGSSLARTKNPSAGEIKKVAPKSLHMSLSLGPSNSDPASLTTTRKSFIMEKMGDKDIVKRAFKTFQNSYNQLKSSSEQISAVPKQTNGTEPRVPSLAAPRKENGGSLKSSAVDKINAKAAPSSFGLRSDERVDKRKEFSKKLEGKSNAREVEKTRIQTKSKEVTEAESKLLRQSVNVKATLRPGLYRGQKVPRNPSDTKVSKNEHHR
ncbi:TPX2 domain-containing protein [Cephalotus follicularis]|uniref:TPX2 domain-containing protein n=1 Tax=Cephalotus follicularis TaxID=3775 RepID=A0A1Q3CMC0_CEPFO|nr:TPX2 domain-containing protein [Cephalotus follicularis]